MNGHTQPGTDDRTRYASRRATRLRQSLSSSPDRVPPPRRHQRYLPEARPIQADRIRNRDIQAGRPHTQGRVKIRSEYGRTFIFTRTI